MGEIVTLGEVVADVYREEAPCEVELPFTARPFLFLPLFTHKCLEGKILRSCAA
jgi:hypothetical protein